MDSERRLNDHEKRILALEESHQLLEKLIRSCERWREETEMLQIEMQDYNKRSQDALDHNTKSNILLVASNEESIKINKELAQAFLEFKSKVETEHVPVINFWNRVAIAMGVNRDLAKWLVAISLGILAIAGVIKLFI